MDREIYFVRECSCYIVRWIADLSSAGLHEHWQRLMDDPEFEPGQAALHDLRGREAQGGYPEISIEREVYEREVAPEVGEGRLAILVDSAVTFGQARQMTMMLGLEGTSLITYSEGEAKTWVGLPPDYKLPYHQADHTKGESESPS